MKNILLLLLPFVVSAGCSTHPPYVCPLHEGTSCQSMQEVYEAARRAPRSAHGERVSLTASTEAAATPKAPSLNAWAPDEPGVTGQPVFKQPKVYRPWLAPYRDSDGNLRSGEYVYFATTGDWNFGGTRTPGEASGAMFGPQQPGRLGFTPTAPKPRDKAAPPKPGDPLPTPPTVTNTAGITQPSETLIQP